MKSSAAYVFVAGMVTAASIYAAAPSEAPSGAMGLCKDGTYSTSAEKQGACRGHKGVQDWYGDAAPAATHGGPRATTSSTTMAPPAAGSQGGAKPSMPATAGRTSGEPTAPAAGGGPGKVWANTITKVYHCAGDKYYGATKHGEYMSESDAKEKGYHADHGKACI
jgi:hypothetical protein